MNTEFHSTFKPTTRQTVSINAAADWCELAECYREILDEIARIEQARQQALAKLPCSRGLTEEHQGVALQLRQLNQLEQSYQLKCLQLKERYAHRPKELKKQLKRLENKYSQQRKSHLSHKALASLDSHQTDAVASAIMVQAVNQHFDQALENIRSFLKFKACS